MAELPRSVKSGIIHLSPKHPIEVHVLDNGKRVIEEGSLAVLFDWMANGMEDAPGEKEAVERLARAIKFGEFEDV